MRRPFRRSRCRLLLARNRTSSDLDGHDDDLGCAPSDFGRGAAWLHAYGSFGTARRNRRHGDAPRNRPAKHAALDSSVHRGAARARRHHERPRPRHHGAERRVESGHRRRSVRFPRSRLARRRSVRRRRVAGRLRLPADEFHRDRARRGVARSARHVVRPQHERRRGQHDDAPAGREFGARVKLDVGDFNRRDVQFAVDVPITDTLKTKFIGATFKNDGFLEGLTTPWDFGSQDDTILRGDILWEPTDTFSLRVTYNDEQKRGTDPKIHRMTRYDNSKVYAYNIMLGGFQAEANAACAAGALRVGASEPAFPTSPAAGARRHSLRHWSAARLGCRLRRSESGRVTRAAPPHITRRRTRRTIRTGSRSRRPATTEPRWYPIEVSGPARSANGRRSPTRWRTASRPTSQYTTMTADVGHHGQPELRGDPVGLAAGPAPSHRLRRHRVPDHDRRHSAGPRERHDRAASVGHGAQRAASTGSPATTRSRRDSDAALSIAGACGSSRSTADRTVSPTGVRYAAAQSTSLLPSTCARPLCCSA